MKKFLHFLLTAAAAAVVIAGCEDKIVSGVPPELEFESTEINAPGGGGEVSVAYRILNPVAGGRLAADPSEDWMENFNAVSDTLITFDVLPNDTDALREGKVTFTYIYGEDGSVPVEVTVRQGPASEEPGDGPSVEADPVPEIPAAGGSVTITYSIVNPVEGGKVSASSEAEWLTDFVSGEEGSVSFNAGANDGEAREAAVVLTYEWADGKVETEVPVSQAAGTSEGYVVEPVNAYGSFRSGSQESGVMNVILVFTDMEVDGWGSETGPGNRISVDSYLPFDLDGNIGPGEYELTSYAGEPFTCTAGWSEEYDGWIYAYGTYLDIWADQYGYDCEYVFWTSGTMTVSGSGDSYDVTLDFVSQNGETLSCSYSGPIEITGIPQPYSCLTGDYTLDLEGATAYATGFGDYMEYGYDKWTLQLSPTGGGQDGVYFELYTPNGQFEDGIPSGTYTAAADYDSIGPWQYMTGSLDPIWGYISGTNYYFYEDGNSWPTAYAPALSGEVTLTVNSDGTYSVSFSFVDDFDNTWDGEWSGPVEMEDMYYAPPRDSRHQAAEPERARIR